MTFHPYHEEIHYDWERVEKKRAIQPCFDCDRCETRIDALGEQHPKGWSTIYIPEGNITWHLCGPCTEVLPALLQKHKHAHEVAEMSVTDMPTNGDSLPAYKGGKFPFPNGPVYDVNSLYPEEVKLEEEPEEDCGCCPCCDCDCDDNAEAEDTPEAALKRIIKIFGIEIPQDVPVVGFLRNIKLGTDE